MVLAMAGCSGNKLGNLDFLNDPQIDLDAWSGFHESFDQSKIPELLDGFKRVAETDILSLYVNEETLAIGLEDKTTGMVYSSNIRDDQYNVSSVNKTWTERINSLFTLDYSALTGLQATPEAVYTTSKHTTGRNASQEPIIQGVRAEYTYQLVDGGIKGTFKYFNIANAQYPDGYDMSSLPVDITVEILFRISNGRLYVTIPVDGITEHNSEYGVVDIKMMPFFGAVDPSADGYVLIPDGSGAVIDFETFRTSGQNPIQAAYELYSDESANIYTTQQKQFYDVYNVTLPLFGVKEGDDAFVCFATKGEGNTRINVDQSGFGIRMHRAYTTFVYRQYYQIMLSNIVVDGEEKNVNALAKMIDRPMTAQHTHEVVYEFLSDGEANYSGMATAYRNYLKENSLLNDNITGTTIPMALDIFMGITEYQAVFDEFVKMTTFDQAKDIVSDLISRGVTNLQVMLSGWSDGGYDQTPTKIHVSSKIGGKSGLKRLGEYLSNLNIPMFLEYQTIVASSAVSGYSQGGDTVITGNGNPLTYREKGNVDTDESLFYLSAGFSYFRNQKLIRYLDNTNASIAFEDMGRIIFQDYNTSYPTSRTETTRLWREIIKETKETTGYVAVQGAGSYSFEFADRLYDIPLKSSKRQSTHYDVPFVQLVLHGSIPYTADPANYFYDFDLQILKWIEYGYTPCYEVTHEASILLKETSYNSLFSSQYELWADQIVEVYKTFNEDLASTWNSYMVLHEQIASNTYRVLYANGTQVFVNYSDHDVLYKGNNENIIVPSLGYVVKEAE